MFKSFAQDQDYLEELRASGGWGRFRFWIWWISADCGRSFVRWGLLSLGMAIAFGIVYYFHGGKTYKTGCPFTILPYHNGLLQRCHIYYARFWRRETTNRTCGDIVMVEVMLGYVMLGGLVWIFANKVARRS